VRPYLRSTPTSPCRLLFVGGTSFRSLVCAFYDLTFSFREFLEEYPHLHSSIVDTLVGNVFNDLNPLYEALGKFAKREARAEISTTTA